MNNAIINRLVTPGNLPKHGIFVASILTILIICWLDIEDGTDIRLRLLYVFPLAALALHSERKGLVVFGFVLTVCCQFFTLLLYDLPLEAKVIEGIVGIAGYLLVVVLARTTRKNHLGALQLATQDSLTMLHNRRSLESTIDHEIARQKRYGGVFSLVAIDLDGFKELNDSRGHRVGDSALKLVADVLHEHSRQSDSLARVGGDEFVILMPNTQKAECAAACQQLSIDIAKHMATAGFATTASIGFTTFEQLPNSTSDALHRADMAMYAAKATGKGSVIGM